MLHLPRKHAGGTLRARWSAVPRALLVIALGAPLAAKPAEPHHVTAVRFWSLRGSNADRDRDRWRFSAEVGPSGQSGPLVLRSGRDPAGLSHKSITVIPVDDHFVRQIRVAEPQPDVTRVVLDLEAAVESTTSRLDNPNRLIIELRAAGSAPETTQKHQCESPQR